MLQDNGLVKLETGGCAERGKEKEVYDGLWETYIVNVGDWNILVTHLFFICLKYYNGQVSK